MNDSNGSTVTVPGGAGAEIPVVVHALTRAAMDALLIELRHPEPGGSLPEAGPGDHIDVRFGGYVRQYSLCSAPKDGSRYLICVKREQAGRGGSKALHKDLRVGETVRISRPRSRFPLRGGARALLLGAGIGVTPLLAMAEALWSEGRAFEFWFYAPDRERAPLVEYIEARPFAGRVHTRWSAHGQSARTALPAELDHPDPGTDVYVCGPTGFMEHVLGCARKAGWGEEQLHRERFAPGAEPAAAGDGSAGFSVLVASSGRAYPVPAGSSIADVLQSNGVEVELSCEQGICGTCVVPVLAGIPDHRDEVLSEAEKSANDQMTICCSRALSAELTLDL